MLGNNAKSIKSNKADETPLKKILIDEDSWSESKNEKRYKIAETAYSKWPVFNRQEKAYKKKLNEFLQPEKSLENNLNNLMLSDDIINLSLPDKQRKLLHDKIINSDKNESILFKKKSNLNYVVDNFPIEPPKEQKVYTVLIDNEYQKEHDSDTEINLENTQNFVHQEVDISVSSMEPSNALTDLSKDTDEPSFIDEFFLKTTTQIETERDKEILKTDDDQEIEAQLSEPIDIHRQIGIHKIELNLTEDETVDIDKVTSLEELENQTDCYYDFVRMAHKEFSEESTEISETKMMFKNPTKMISHNLENQKAWVFDEMTDEKKSKIEDESEESWEWEKKKKKINDNEILFPEYPLLSGLTEEEIDNIYKEEDLDNIKECSEGHSDPDFEYLDSFTHVKEKKIENFTESMYLKKHLGKYLKKALVQVANLRPTYPIEFIARFLYKQNELEQELNKQKILKKEIKIIKNKIKTDENEKNKRNIAMSETKRFRKYIKMSFSKIKIPVLVDNDIIDVSDFEKEQGEEEEDEKQKLT